MSLSASPIVPLTQANSRPRCGKKASLLAQVMAAGFEVPLGFVITSDVFLWHLQASGLLDTDPSTADSRQIKEAYRTVTDTEIDPDIWQLIAEAYENLACKQDLLGPRVVVRASSDPYLPGAYDGVVGVTGLEQLQRAIKCVWSSAWTEHAAALARKNVTSRRVELAVLVQLMVDGKIRGLTVTANHSTGNPNQVVTCIENDSRLKNYVFDLHTLEFEQNEPFDPNSIVQLSSERAIFLESIVGSPAEIEWAYDGSKLWILQAQQSEGIPPYFPVSINKRVAHELTRLTRGPVSVLSRSILWPGERIRPVKLPLRATEEELHLINNFVYRHSPAKLQDNSVLKDPHVQDGEIRRAQRQLGKILLELPRVSTRVSALLNEDLSRLSVREMRYVIREAATLYERTVDLLDYSRYPSYRFPRLLRELLGSGTDAESTYQKLITAATQPLLVRDVVMQDLADRLGAARSSNKIEDDQWRAEFRDEIQNFAREYCYAFEHLGEPYDVASWKTWVEDQEILFRIIAALARRGKRSSLLGLMEARKNSLPQARDAVLEVLTGRAREHMTNLITQSLAWLEVRSSAGLACARAGTALRLAMLELGRRLTDSGVLFRPQDIFYLKLDECEQFSSQKPTLIREEAARLLADRKHQLWLQKRLQAPEKLPAELEASAGNRHGDFLKGQPCSPGIAKGRVLIAASLSEACTAEPGHIIVVREIASAWTPLLGVACGFISEDPCETVISSAAALYGTPIVSDCQGATRAFSGGELIELDGITGRVRYL